MSTDGQSIAPGPALHRLHGALDILGVRSADPQAFCAFAEKFTPAQAVGVAKRRIGADADGGYVMLDRFGPELVSLSFGVGDETSWDRQMAGMGALVHQYDHTVSEPAGLPPSIRFHRQQIVAVADASGVTLEQALAKLDAERRGGTAILKIDIEGDEWAVFDTVPDAVLRRFDQIVCEYHDFEQAADAAWFERACRAMSRLDRLFQVVHVHGNNNRPIMVVDGVAFPWVLEVTHANRELYQFQANTEEFPTPLDSPNHSGRPDYWLGTFSFGTDRRPRAAGDSTAGYPASTEAGSVSHATNGEDVVLHRALGTIDVGHYVDIGPGDPAVGSVTKLLYDRGWWGINAESSRAALERLAAARSRDRNVRVAVSARAGLACGAEAQRGATGTADDIPVLSLADLCRELPFETTHLLRLDGDSVARGALLGADFASFRPWIVIAAEPMAGGDPAWREPLERAGYHATLFDGMNRYFVAPEQAHLSAALGTPANSRDGFVPERLDRAEAAEAELRLRLAQLQADLDRRDHTVAAQAAERAAIEGLIRGQQGIARSIEVERDRLRGEVQRLTDALGAQERHLLEVSSAQERRLIEELGEARGALRTVQDGLERERLDTRRRSERAAERHAEEIEAIHGQLARLAHHEARSERLRQVSDIVGGRAGLAQRGAELLDLRAELLDQADRWQAEIEALQRRLGEASARYDSLQASTSWRVTSPLRGLRRATDVFRREPHRIPELVRQGARGLLNRPGSDDVPQSSAAPAPDEAEVHALVAVAARLDTEMAALADLLGSVAGAAEGAAAMAGPLYEQARLDEQLTRWILGEVARQRRAAA